MISGLTLIFLTAGIAAAAWAVNRGTYNVWAAAWIAPTLVLFSVAIATRAARVDGDPLIGRIVLVGAIVKIVVGPLARYSVAFGLYGGSSDSAIYHNVGAMLAPQFRRGDYSQVGQLSGTRFIGVLTGQIYAVTGATRVGGYLIYSWMSFLGLYFFYRAFRIAYPDGDHRRYAVLLFFVPSLIFWPASIGKEAFMLLVLGGAALGAAHLLAGRLRGLVWLGLGLWGAAVVRPHMALIFGSGLIVAAVLTVIAGGPRRRRAGRGRLGAAVMAVGLMVASSSLIGSTEHFFHLESLNSQTAQEVFDQTTQDTGKNGSTFRPVSPNSPGGFAAATATVLLRPLPFEAGSAQGMVASGEGLVLLGLALLSFRRLTRLPIELLRRPYVALAVAYTAAFIYAFASVANFGLLARQRVQLLPVIFVLLCLRPRGADQSDRQVVTTTTGDELPPDHLGATR